MAATAVKSICKAVIRRAQRQGFVSPSDIRQELKQAGLPGTRWKDVVADTRRELSYREGLYWYVEPDPGVQDEQRHQQEAGRAVRKLIRQHRKSADQLERRREGRADFIQPVQVHTEEGRVLTLLTRDISPAGIRLIGTRSLLGQKVRVRIAADNGEPVCFQVRILWTCTIGDELFENGGSFLEVLPQPGSEAAPAGNGTAGSP